MAGIGKIKSILTTPDSLATYRKNLGWAEADPDFEIDPAFADPVRTPEQNAERVGRVVAEHIEDSPRYGLHPEELISGIDDSMGDPALTQLAGNEFFRHMGQMGTPYRQSKMEREGLHDLRRTITGNAPTTVIQSPIASHFMDEGSNRMAVTQVRPSHLFDNLTGDPEHSKKIALRQSIRNLPYGKDNAHIFHMGNHLESLEQPWLFFRDLKNGLAEPGGLQGYSEPITRSVWLNAGRDPTYSTPSARSGPMNVGTHEAIHTILDGQNPSKEHLRSQKYMNADSAGSYVNPNARPAVADIKHSLLQPGSRYTANDAAEIGNALFHTKRLTEITHPGMRDVGENETTLKNWLDFARNYEMTGADPIIDKPGHPLEGTPAHGFEAQMRVIQDILNNAGPDGARDIDDINFKTAQTPDLRKALLG